MRLSHAKCDRLADGIQGAETGFLWQLGFWVERKERAAFDAVNLMILQESGEPGLEFRGGEGDVGIAALVEFRGKGIKAFGEVGAPGDISLENVLAGKGGGVGIEDD